MSLEDYVDFSNAISDSVRINSSGADECLEMLKPSLTWIAMYLRVSPSECDILLKGCYGSAVESISLISCGLVRPAILSLRSHYELSLQYLYYKDHPVEWRNVKCFKSQPSLPGVIKKYLRENFPDFEYRLKKLSEAKESISQECYDILSGIAHGTALNSISTATKPKELIENEATVRQSYGVFLNVGETLSDIHLACHESNWLSIPPPIQQKLKERFGNKNPKEELRFS
ncbi:hypothetical protein [Acetobacter ghanensis]|uniref:Uncharacterized protein n=1 Tax=Acetobacter ghanensis TaxID=431306 RepID=A0ABX0KPR5_9PROT|nr:hypothetical protein [Acetobacter ghanensis]NHO40496.1 hypothetical protein [Acetobacter ghanensis]GBQ46864.1 hypothetical protein AA18895_0894 [Acetobacter ghanensis DSM 18895]